MNFFLQIHRSIVDPSFYSEVIILPAKRRLAFLVKLVIITALILTFTHTWRVVEHKKGLPAILPALFPYMQITSNGMSPNRKTPYTVNTVYIADFMSTFTNFPMSSFEISDSAVVVDGRSNIVIDKNSSILFLLAADIIHVSFKPDIYFTIPYSLFVSEKEVMTFSKEGISEYLKQRLLKLSINFFIQHLVTFGSNIMISIFFLSFAAYIFRTRQIRGFKTFLKLASFAITPVAIEKIFVALSGARIVGVWHVSIFISVFIIYRAIKHLSIQDSKAEPMEK